MRALAVLLLLTAPAGAFEIKLDSDVWVAKLNQLCQGAIFAARMFAEPVCAELNSIVTAAAALAQEEERKKAAAAELPKPPPQQGVEEPRK